MTNIRLFGFCQKFDSFLAVKLVFYFQTTQNYLSASYIGRNCYYYCWLPLLQKCGEVPNQLCELLDLIGLDFIYADAKFLPILDLLLFNCFLFLSRTIWLLIVSLSSYFLTRMLELSAKVCVILQEWTFFSQYILKISLLSLTIFFSLHSTS